MIETYHAAQRQQHAHPPPPSHRTMYDDEARPPMRDSDFDRTPAAVPGPGPRLGLMTPREAETRELREFWKAYMRTPLTGPSGGGPGGPLGAPALAGSSSEGPANPDSPEVTAHANGSGYRRLRRNSLPSVKTPTADDWNGPGGYAGYPSHTTTDEFGIDPNAGPPHPYAYDPNPNGPYNPQQFHQFALKAPPPGAQESGVGGIGGGGGIHAHHRAVDDLRSYEEAVLARKTPMLKLPGGGDVGGGVPGGMMSGRRARSGTVPRGGEGAFISFFYCFVD